MPRLTVTRLFTDASFAADDRYLVSNLGHPHLEEFHLFI